MPRINHLTGEILGGPFQGGGVISIDGVPIWSAGSARGWFNREEFCIQDLAGPAPSTVRIKRTATGLNVVPLFPEGPGGANDLFGGNGQAARWSSTDGYRDTYGRHRPGWRVLDIDPTTGYIAVSKRGGLGISVLGKDFEVDTVPDDQIVAMHASFHFGGLLYSKDQINWEIVGGPIMGTFPLRVQMSNPRHYQGNWFVGNGAHGVVVFHRSSPERGVVVNDIGYNPDISFWNDKVLVATALTQGEAPASIRRYEIDFAFNTGQPTINGERTAYVNLLKPPLPAIEPFTHAMWLAPYWAWTDRADYGKTKVGSNAQVLATRRPLEVEPPGQSFLGDYVPGSIVADGTPVVPDDKFIGYYLGTETGANSPEFKQDLRLFKNEAIRRKRPLYLLWDQPGATVANWDDFLEDYAQPEQGLEICPMPEMYPLPGATPRAHYDHWDAVFGALVSWGYRPAAATTLYTQSDNWPLDLILALQPYIADIVRKYKLHLVAPFAIGRPSGTVTYPALADVFRRWVGACSSESVPPFLVLKGSNQMTVTIKSFDAGPLAAPATSRAVAEVTGPVAKLQWLFRLVGASAWTVATTNAATDLDHGYTFPSPGSFEIKLRGLDANGTVVAETGLQRIVTVIPGAQPEPTDDPLKDEVRKAITTLRTVANDLAAKL